MSENGAKFQNSTPGVATTPTMRRTPTSTVNFPARDSAHMIQGTTRPQFTQVKTLHLLYPTP